MTIPVSDSGLPLSVLSEGIPRGREGLAQPVAAGPRKGRGSPSFVPSLRISISIATVVGLTALWWIAAVLKLVPPLFLPGPDVVAARLARVVTEGYLDATLAQHLAASLSRVFGALAVALVIGIPAGLTIGLSTVGRGILDPIVEFVRPIPPLAYLPLVVIWAGIGEASKVLVIALAMLPPIIISTASGARSVAKDRLNVTRALGASGGQLVRFVVLPSALPSILTGTRIALGAGWSTLVAAELVAATRGVGFMIQSAANFLATDVVIGGIVVIAVVAFVLEAAIRLIERWLVPWAYQN